MERTDGIVIIGGGIVGLATAFQVGRRLAERGEAGRPVIVIEKESTVAAHQTGHNSGVLHSGVYYKPRSLKALNCRRGKAMMEAFCTEHDIPFEICGKVIVALNETERLTLRGVFERGQANGVACRMIGREELRELEPHAAGVEAIHVEEAGIVDYSVVCEKLADEVRSAGGEVMLGTRAERIAKDGAGDGADIVIETANGRSIRAAAAVNCAGLHSDRVARKAGREPGVRIIPFRGEYYELREQAWPLCRNLIYPTPNPSFPFLGVHLTRMIHGGVECGPNAVLAFAREGYLKRSVNARDLLEAIGYPGLWRLARKYWRTGAGEMWRSVSTRAFVTALQRLVPDLRAEDLSAAPAGVRAQAIAPDGSMVDDFRIERDGPIVHVLNAPSPAATSALSIGDTVADEVFAGSERR